MELLVFQHIGEIEILDVKFTDVGRNNPLFVGTRQVPSFFNWIGE